MDLESHHFWWKNVGKQHVNHVLLEEWNPIGVGVPSNEYASYAGTVGSLLYERRPASEIAASLTSARERMGLSVTEDDALLDAKVAASLVAWYARESD